MNGDLVEHLKLSVRFSADSRLLEIAPDSRNNRGKSSWVRQKILAHPPADNVFLYKSSHGEESQVIKRIRRQDEVLDHRRELQLMKRVWAEVKPDEKELFVDLTGWFSSADYIYFVMEYCPYGDISHLATPMLELDAWGICNQLIEGLSILHRIGIIHRDIKPQNILVASINPTQVKIADFGISKLAHADDAQIATQPTTRIGTPGYMAPERLDLIETEGSTHTPAIDVWSLGCVMYYLSTGSIPFTKEGSVTYDSYRALQDYCNGILPFPKDPLVINGVSLSGQRFMQRLLAPLPRNRPHACKELIKDWELPSSRDHGSKASSEQDNSPQLPLTDNVCTTESGLFNMEDLANKREMAASSALWQLVKSEARGQIDMNRLRSLLLVDEASPDISIKGYTALHTAAEQGTAESVRELLKYCNNPNARTMPHQETAIHLATVQADPISFKEKLTLLLEKNVDINTPNLEGDTVLHLAIRRMGSVQAIEFLIDRGASTTLKGRHGRTPLHYAVYLEREDLADALIRHDANPYCEDNDRVTPLHVAAKSKKLSIPLLNSLIKDGYHINHEDSSGRTPLFEAAIAGRHEVIRLLADRGGKCRPHSAKLGARISQAYERPLFSLRMPRLSWSAPSE